MPVPPFFTPMLATSVAHPFDSDDHLFEVKWDGVRTLAFIERGRTRLFSRSGREVTHQYPEFDNLHKQLRVDDAVLDGEIVALEEGGRPSFELLQQRIGLTRPSDVARGQREIALDLVLFDAPHVSGEWLGGTPLEARLNRLDESFEFGERVIRSQMIEREGVALFTAAKSRGLEGVVAKRKGSHYFPARRTRDWLKIKVIHRIDCVIGGWSAGAGSRGSSFGSLLLGVYDAGVLRYIGNVGTGFDDRTLDKLRTFLTERLSDASPFSEKIPSRGVRWVRPELVCEVEYRELTRAFRLRAASFKRLRDDKLAIECVVEASP